MIGVFFVARNERAMHLSFIIKFPFYEMDWGLHLFVFGEIQIMPNIRAHSCKLSVVFCLLRLAQGGFLASS